MDAWTTTDVIPTNPLAASRPRPDASRPPVSSPHFTSANTIPFCSLARRKDHRVFRYLSGHEFFLHVSVAA